MPFTARRVVGTVRFIRHPARTIGGQQFAGFDEDRFVEIASTEAVAGDSPPR
jgi:hypothetical protein